MSGTHSYENVYRRSVADPESFWAEAAEQIQWDKRWSKVLDRSAAPATRWFSGGRLNTCYNALDRHVEGGRAEQLALIYDSPVTGTVRHFTYRQLTDRVAHFAGALARLGVRVGDRVVIYMPMVPETVVAMLGCARLGAIHSVVFGGFASRELAIRIDDAQPKVIVSASCGIEPSRIIQYKPLLDEALDMAEHQPKACLILQRPIQRCELVVGRDHDFEEAVAATSPHDCVSVEATAPLYILYTSGTTGRPKGVVRDNGGHAVALYWSVRHIYGSQPGETYWAASDLGWAVGHSYIVYGPLLHGNTTILYEGKPVGTPDAGAFWRVISEHKVACFFTAPTAIRAIKREDSSGSLAANYDLSRLRALFLAGERTDPDTLAWAQKMLKIPVVDHWWQTETGWPICANCLGIEPLRVPPGSAGRPVPGWNVQVLDDSGLPLPASQIGSLVVKQPPPPGMLPTLWNDENRYRRSYFAEFEGFYKTADAGYVDNDGCVFVMGRTDDIINVAGHRLSTGAMEEVLSSHADVAECAVIGVADSLKGQLPLGLLVLKSEVKRSPQEIVAETVAMVREQIGPVACFKQALVVNSLPKTRSGKVLRATLRQIADGDDWKMPATIEDPDVLAEIQAALATLG